MRIAIELEEDAYPKKISEYVYKFTDLQRTFHLNMLALVDGIEPRILNLRKMFLELYICTRKEIGIREEQNMN